MAINFLNTVQVDTDVLYVDTENDRVGIGTASPASKLVVQGAGEQWISVFTTDVTGVGALNGYRTQTSTGSMQNTLYRHTATNLVTLRAGTDDGAINFIAGGSTAERMRILANGNVGIGTDNPSSLLTIGANGVSTLKPTVIFTDTTNGSSLVLRGQSPILAFDKTGTGVPKILMDAGGLQFKTGTLDAEGDIDMVILPDGNVGIGTNSPTAKLHVTQDAIVQGVIRANNVDLGLGGAIKVKASNNAVDQYVAFGTTPSGSNGVATFTEKMRITSAGNVGIGTTSPTAPLHIEGGTNNEVLKIEADVSPFIRWVKSGSDVGFLQFTSTSAYLSNMSNGSFFFRTNNTDKMTITSAGNVGIGTTSPPVKFVVNNGVARTSTAKTYSTFVHANDTDDFRIGLATAIKGGAASADRYISIEGASYEVSTDTFTNEDIDLVLNPAAGNVGIGTTSPGAKLEVAKGSEGLYFSAGGDTADARSLEFTSSANNGSSGAMHTINARSGNGVIALATASSEKMRIEAGGNVGIGTTDPSTKLQIDNQGVGEFDGANSSVAGESHIMLKDIGGTSRTLMSGPSIVFQTPANADGTNIWATSRLLGSPAAAGSARGTFSIQVRDQYDPFSNGTSWNWRTALTAINTGNVGIGTTSPDYKLQIATPSITSGSTYSWPFDLTRAGASSTRGFSIGVGTPGGNVALGNHNGDMSLGQTFGVDSNGLPQFYETMRISHDGTASSGNVGIGTTSPSQKLQIGEISSGGGSTAPDAITLGKTFSSVAGQNLKMRVYDDGTNQAGIGISLGQLDYSVWATSANHVFYAATSELMRINGNGNVGIGTSTPGTQLDIVSAGLASMFRLSNTEANATTKYAAILGRHYTNTEENVTGMLITSNSNATGGSVSIGGGITAANATNNVIFYTAANNTTLLGSERMRINSSGNVGIGTTSPDLKLDVISGTNNGIRISADDTSNSWKDIAIRTYVTQAQANALPDGSSIYTTNPASQTETAFSKFGGLVIQGRDNGNSSFAIRLGNGSGYATRMFMGATGATVFSNTVTSTNFILSSDKRLKENIEKVCDNRVKADWKTFELKTEKGEKRYGVIAQELEENHPEFIKTDNEGFKSVKYIDLLIAKIAELEARLEKAGI